MCNHRYTLDYKRAPKGIGTRCPYPDLFDKLRSSTRGASQSGSDLTLPHDNLGACIFHSRDIKWKRRNGFGDRFVELMDLLATYAEGACYDFAEFVFVDDGLPVETERGQPAFRIQGRTFAKPTPSAHELGIVAMRMEGVSAADFPLLL